MPFLTDNDLLRDARQRLDDATRPLLQQSVGSTLRRRLEELTQPLLDGAVQNTVRSHLDALTQPLLQSAQDRLTSSAQAVQGASDTAQSWLQQQGERAFGQAPRDVGDVGSSFEAAAPRTPSLEGDTTTTPEDPYGEAARLAQNATPQERGPIEGALVGTAQGVGEFAGNLASSARRLVTTPEVPRAIAGAVASSIMPGLLPVTPEQRAAVGAAQGQLLQEQGPEMLQAAGDVANVIPQWQAANAGFMAARGATLGSGVLPEKATIAGREVPVAEPVALGTGLVAQMGVPGVARAAGRAFLGEGVQGAASRIRQVAQRAGQAAAGQYDEAGLGVIKAPHVDREPWQMTAAEYAQTPMVRVIGEDYPPDVIHGTTGVSARAFISGTEPERVKQTMNEFGRDVIYVSEKTNPHQALQFGNITGAAPGYGGRTMLEFRLKPGTPVLDVTPEMTRQGAFGHDMPVKIGGRPTFTDDMAKWLNEARARNGVPPLPPDEVLRAVDPTQAGFHKGEYTMLLSGYARDRGYGALRLADETLILRRDVIESARRLSRKETQALQAAGHSPRYEYPQHSLFTPTLDEAARGEAHREAVAQALREGKPVPPQVLAEYPDLAPGAPGAPVAPDAHAIGERVARQRLPSPGQLPMDLPPREGTAEFLGTPHTPNRREVAYDTRGVPTPEQVQEHGPIPGTPEADAYMARTFRDTTGTYVPPERRTEPYLGDTGSALPVRGAPEPAVPDGWTLLPNQDGTWWNAERADGVTVSGGRSPEDAAAAARRWGDRPLPSIAETPAAGLGIVQGGARRFYHGTGSTFATPDPEKFDPNGLYGPAYYLTDEPRVASSYAETRAPAYQKKVELQALLDRARANAAKATGPNDQTGWGNLAARYEQQLASLEASGPQVRPVDVPEGLRLLDAEAPVSVDDARAVLNGLPGRSREFFLKHAFYNDEATSVVPKSGDELYRLVRRAEDLTDVWTGGKPGYGQMVDSGTKAAQDLQRAGFDGIRYGGGQMMPIMDAAGAPVQHTAVAIFGPSLPKLRNALSGAPGGIVSPAGIGDTLRESFAAAVTPPFSRAATTRGEVAADVASGVAGAAASQAGTDEQTPWQERVGRAATGFALGAAAGPQVRNLAGVARGVSGALADEAISAARKGASAAAAKAAPVTRESVGEAFDRILTSQREGATPAAPSNAIAQALSSVRTKVDQYLFDQHAPMRVLQEQVYKALGRAPTAAEDLYTQVRLYAGRSDAAAQRVRDDLLPAIKGLRDDEVPALNAYLAAADNADKAAAVGQRVSRQVAAQGLARRLPQVRVATDLVKQSQWAKQVESAAGKEVERLAAEWDDAATRLNQIEERLTFLKEGDVAALERPPWARAQGKGQRALSDADLAEIAQRSGLNVYEPNWWQAVDAETVRLYRAEATKEGGLAGKSRAQLAAEAKGLRAERLVAQRRLRELDPQLEKQLVAQSSAAAQAERLRGAERLTPALFAAAQAEGATAGERAAAGRVFSGAAGGVHAHALDAVDAELTARYGPETAQKLRDAAQGVWDFTTALRNRLRDAGIISDATWRDWNAQYPHYVKADILKYLPERGGAGFSSAKPVATLADTGIKALSEEGTAAARDLPLNSVIRQTFAVEALARRNQAAQAVLRMRQHSPELQELLTPRRKGPLTQQPEQTTFSVFVDGKRQEFVGPKSLEGVFRLESFQIPDAFHVAATLGGAPLLRAGATGLNALFLPTNLLRDAQMYMLRTGGYASLRKAAVNGGQLARAYWDSFARGGGKDWAAALKAGAGQTSEFSGSTPAETLRRLTGEGGLGGRVRPVTTLRDFLGAVGDVASLPLAPVRTVGEAVERAPRLAAYRLATKAGQAPEQAALAARDVTLDFSRGGLLTKFVNTFVPFFNVAAQSSERLVRYDLSKGRRLQTGIGLVTGLLVPVVAAEAWNRSQYPDDYAQVPTYLKDTGTVIMLPQDPAPNPDGTPGQRPYVWVPLPQEYAFLGTLTRQALAAGLGDDRRGWGDVLQSVVGSFSPVGAEAGGVLSRVLPPAVRTGVELQANYDFYRGRPIVPDRLQNLPAGEQATAQTSALGRGVGRALNKPPAAVDYAVSSTMGGVGRQLLAASDAAARAFGLPAAEPTRAPAVDVPVAGGLAGSVIRNAGGQKEQDQWRALDREQAAMRDKLLAQIRATEGYQNASPQIRALMDKRVSGRVAAAFDKRRAAIKPKPLPPTPPAAPGFTAPPAG